MQVIYEVRVESNRKETLYPIGTATNNVTAANKVRELNKRLEKNRGIFEGLYSQLRNHFNGNLGMFTAAERKQYDTLEHINSIKEYRHEFINDKRVERYNPMDADRLVPRTEKEAAKSARKTPAKKSTGPKKPSKK